MIIPTYKLQTYELVKIDILAVDDENAILGECKWKNEPIGIGILKELMEKGELLLRNWKKLQQK